MERVDTIHIILLSRDELLSQGFDFIPTPGNIKIDDEQLIARHQDIHDLDLDLLAKLSRLIHAQSSRDENCHCLTKSKIKKLLCTAIEEKRLNLLKLEPRQKSLRDEVEKALSK